MRGVRRKIKHIINLPNDYRYTRDFRHQIRVANRELSKGGHSKGAIVLHLYYLEMWPYFRQKLDYLLTQGHLDLFVSVQQKDYQALQGSIDKDLKDHTVVLLPFPNRGRDVLPFIYTYKLLRDHNYEYVLKIHSKKSPQRTDGADWAGQMFDRLITQDEKSFDSLRTIMTDKKTAIIGPKGSYVPLPTYYNDNHPNILRLVAEIEGPDIARKLDEDKWDYGFFAGTMFWARISSIEGVMNAHLPMRHFIEEGGQLDGTVAHALERLFCVVPELNGYNMYEMSERDITQIPYKTDYTPEWSDHYRGGE